MKKQRGDSTLLGIAFVVILLIIVIGSLKECSLGNFEQECKNLGGVAAGNVCVKPDSVIKKRYN